MFVLARAWVLAASCVLLPACGSSEAPPTDVPVEPDPEPEPVPEPKVLIGVPAGEDELSFAELAADSELRLQTFGQGGTHVMLGVRCIGFGQRVFVDIEIENTRTGAISVTPAPVRAQLLYCDVDENTCDLVPILGMTSGLTEPGEDRDGLPIEIRVRVHNAAGLTGEAHQTAVLSTADL